MTDGQTNRALSLCMSAHKSVNERLAPFEQVHVHIHCSTEISILASVLYRILVVGIATMGTKNSGQGKPLIQSMLQSPWFWRGETWVNVGYGIHRVRPLYDQEYSWHDPAGFPTLFLTAGVRIFWEKKREGRCVTRTHTWLKFFLTHASHVSNFSQYRLVLANRCWRFQSLWGLCVYILLLGVVLQSHLEFQLKQSGKQLDRVLKSTEGSSLGCCSRLYRPLHISLPTREASKALFTPLAKEKSRCRSRVEPILYQGVLSCRSHNSVPGYRLPWLLTSR